MKTIRSLLAALGLAFALGAAATAPALAADPVLVVDLERVYAESAAGKDAQAKLKGIADSIRKELEPEGKAVETEAAGLDSRFKGKTRQQIGEELQKDAALQGKFKSYQQRLNALAQKEDLRNAELQTTQRKAINDVLAAADPIVEEIRNARGAAVVLGRGSVLKVAPNADITGEVINKLNGKIKAVAVAKVDLSKQAQQR